MKKWYEVEKSKEIYGSVQIQGSKNSSLGLLAASCLTNKKVILRGLPNILDVKIICELGRDIGIKINNIEKK